MMQWIKEIFMASIASIFLIILLSIFINQVVKANLEDQSTKEVLTEIEQKGVSIKTFGAKGDGISDDTTAIRKAFNSEEGNLYFPKGVYKITAPIVVDPGKNKNVTGESNVVISAYLVANQNLFTLNRNMSFKNIEFDFNNGSLKYGLFYKENLGKIILENLKFRNVKDINSALGTIVVFVQAQGTQLTAKNIHFENMNKKGNGIIGDAAGNLTCLYINNTTQDSKVSAHLKGIKIVNVHNIDKNNKIMFEDISGIFIVDSGMPKNNKILIEDIHGHNFGKRLIKLQASNVDIRKVVALSETNDSLSAIGVQADPLSTEMNKNNTIIDVKVRGKFHIALASNSKNTIFRDIDIDIERPSLAGNTPIGIGIQIAGGNTLVENGKIKAELPLENIKKYGGKLQVKDITIVPKSLKLNRLSLAITPSQTYKVAATVAPSNAVNKTVVWKSSNTKVATVDASGNIKGITNGFATITATARDNAKAMKRLTVKVSAKTVKLNKTALSLTAGKTGVLTATVSPADSLYKTVTWKSSNAKVAAVDSKGKVIAKAKGTATITAIVKSAKAATAKVTVTSTVAANREGEKIFSDPRKRQDTHSVVIRQPSNTANKTLTLKSSNTKAAKVASKGQVTAIAAGTAKITATTTIAPIRFLPAKARN
ncbi:Ig-like domain-containing protein [Planococcus shixiaomingii]|uniref:Ig-like domain-containing protein n=1 Tax=Planococcus shixiaomingii TaxID=3058393 RepID=UPI0026050A95|nr:Ig-like domain-containing protein [Planococcus sp. N022]WKA53989.1 Ig-like domain-containing protein [Planococcus sp. N022]